MALLQPAPEVYNLFDDIMLLAEGHIVYYGPKEEVRVPLTQPDVCLLLVDQQGISMTEPALQSAISAAA